MIRVVYRVNVQPEHVSAFVEGWKEMTEAIRSSRPGALGSVLLGDPSDPSVYLAMATWQSLEHFEAHQKLESAQPEASAKMNAVSTWAETKVYDVIEDLSV